MCVCVRLCASQHTCKILQIQSSKRIKKAPDFIPLCSKGPNKQLAKGSESCS